MVQIQEHEPLTFENFLSKFTILRLIYRSPEIITRITREAIEDAAADNVRYMELRFTPIALSRAQGFPLPEVIDWVIAGAQQANHDFGIITRLIVSVNRHEEIEQASQVAELAAARIDDGVVGLDLAGNEAEFSAAPFESVFKSAAKAGLHISIHAGEWGPGENVFFAIETMGAERIAHGIRVLESPTAVRIAKEQQTAFEVCLTSNYQSGAVLSIQDHPLKRMLEAGLNVTINTDDPGISQINLSNEYRLACEVLNFSLARLRARIAAAAQATFLPHLEQQRLTQAVLLEFDQVTQIT
jgi:adenosine deaminase